MSQNNIFKQVKRSAKHLNSSHNPGSAQISAPLSLSWFKGVLINAKPGLITNQPRRNNEFSGSLSGMCSERCMLGDPQLLVSRPAGDRDPESWSESGPGPR